jgi:hypothetical protein
MGMRDEAERYCALIEQAESWERQAFAVTLAASLAGLLSAASQLPNVRPTDFELQDRPDQQQWSDRFIAVQRVLGEWADYWTTLAPYGDDASEAVLLPLARRPGGHLARSQGGTARA